MANGCITNGTAVVHTHGQVERYGRTRKIVADRSCAELPLV